MRTKLCAFFNTTHGCKNGLSCPFQHIRLQDAEKPICKYYLSSTGCKYGNKCFNRHVIVDSSKLEDEEEELEEEQATIEVSGDLSSKKSNIVKPSSSKSDENQYYLLAPSPYNHSRNTKIILKNNGEIFDYMHKVYEQKRLQTLKKTHMKLWKFREQFFYSNSTVLKRISTVTTSFEQLQSFWQSDGFDSLSTAEQWKEKGNQFFAAQQFEDSILCYTVAIDLLFKQEQEEKLLLILYGNRAIALIKINELIAAVEDCEKVLAKEPFHSKCLYRRSLAFQGLQFHYEAYHDLSKLSNENLPLEIAQLKYIITTIISNFESCQVKTTAEQLMKRILVKHKYSLDEQMKIVFEQFVNFCKRNEDYTGPVLELLAFEMIQFVTIPKEITLNEMQEITEWIFCIYFEELEDIEQGSLFSKTMAQVIQQTNALNNFELLLDWLKYISELMNTVIQSKEFAKCLRIMMYCWKWKTKTIVTFVKFILSQREEEEELEEEFTISWLKIIGRNFSEEEKLEFLKQVFEEEEEIQLMAEQWIVKQQLQRYAQDYAQWKQFLEEEKQNIELKKPSILTPAILNRQMELSSSPNLDMGKTSKRMFHAVALARNRLDLVHSLENSVEENLLYEYGSTLLHIAAWMGEEQEVEFLLAMGADKRKRMETGETPLDIALLEKRKANPRVIALLK